jgi:hypothetical protein
LRDRDPVIGIISILGGDRRRLKFVRKNKVKADHQTTMPWLRKLWH